MDAAGNTRSEVPATISSSAPPGAKSAAAASKNAEGSCPPKSTVVGFTAGAPQPAHRMGVLAGGPSAGS